MATKEVKQLSNSVLALKFMHRAEEAKVRQKLEDDKKKQDEEAQWVVVDVDDDEAESLQFEYDNSYLPFMKSTFGRRSFGEFNKEIEKLADHAVKAERLRKAEANEKREAISEKEMARRYQQIQVNGNSNGNSEGKKKRRREKADEAGKNTVNDTTKTDWSQHPGRQATRFSSTSRLAAAEEPLQKGFIKPQI